MHVGPQVPRVPVPDLHRDLAVQEQEPFDAIVAVRDRQDVLLRRRAEQAVLHRGHDLRVPRHVVAGEVVVQVQEAEPLLVFRLDLHLAVLALDPLEGLVDRVRRVRPRFLDHRLRHDPLPVDRRMRAAAFPTEGTARFPRRGPRIELGRHPVLEDRLERRADLLVREHLAVRLAALLPGVVVLPEEHVDAVVVEVERPEHLVEFHHAVEEVPPDVPLDGPQELPDGHVVLAAGIVDHAEVRVPLERELSEAEGLVAEFVRLPRFHEVLRFRDHRHSSVRQISFHAYVSQGLCFVCRRASDFFLAFM